MKRISYKNLIIHLRGKIQSAACTSLFLSFGSLVGFDSNHIFTDGPQLLLVLLDEGGRGRGLPGTVAVVHPALALDGIVQRAVERCLGAVERGLDGEGEEGVDAPEDPVCHVSSKFRLDDTFKIERKHYEVK